MTTDPRAFAVLTCFKSVFPICGCTPPIVTVYNVLEHVRRGHYVCKRCKRDVDLRGLYAVFPTLGALEGLFGLEVWSGQKPVPESKEPGVMHLDPFLDLQAQGADVHPSGEILFANITNVADERDGPDEMPRLLAPQRSTDSWFPPLRFYVPPGGKRALGLRFVFRPKEDLPIPLEIAIQAVSAFHRKHLSVAALLLLSSIEASLRARLLEVYKRRGVRFPDNLGFAALMERAALFFDPPPGAQLHDDVKKLAKVRNDSAHGTQSTAPSREDVARWMTVAATIYEWSRHANLRL